MKSFTFIAFLSFISQSVTKIQRIDVCPTIDEVGISCPANVFFEYIPWLETMCSEYSTFPECDYLESRKLQVCLRRDGPFGVKTKNKVIFQIEEQMTGNVSQCRPRLGPYPMFAQGDYSAYYFLLGFVLINVVGLIIDYWIVGYGAQ